MVILEHERILQTTRRMAYQIIEANYNEDSLVIIGINKNGLRFAEMLHQYIQEMNHPIQVTLANLTINPAQPVGTPVDINMDLSDLENANILVVDDVANTGRTIYYGLKPLLDILLRKVEIAVLVDRKHKSFPIKVDYVGMSLATTIQDNIKANLVTETEYNVHLV